MKTKINFIALILMLSIGSLLTIQKASAQGYVDFQVFYDELSPYGTWVDNANYGYVWVPNVDSTFVPYATNGYWICSDYGWTWVSDYSWDGHLFTMVVGSLMQYMAACGYQIRMGPGWVSWRSCDGYYGWAPIGPGISASVAYSNNYEVPDNEWRL